MELLTGFVLAALISLIAKQLGALSNKGFWGAVVMGGLIFGLGGIAWAALLLTFFISSSTLSRLSNSRKQFTSTEYAKGSRRDFGQVLANGGLGIILVIINALLPERTELWFAYIGGIAAVNADTWATEMGVFSRKLPRLITTGKLVERGTSGGVSLAGYTASLAGGLLVGGVAVIFTTGANGLLVLLGATLAGLVGSTFDSLLGATVQAMYYCPVCKKETERHPLHTCSTQTIHVRGWFWLNNDWVNFACSLVGAISMVGFAALFS